MKKIRIGDVLLNKQLITKSQLDLALAKQKKTGKQLGETLIEMQFITESKLLSALSELLDLPIIDLSSYSLDSKTSLQLPENYAIRYRCILLDKKNDHYLVGMIDPLDIIAYDEICRVLKSKIDLALIGKEHLEKKIAELYSRDTEIKVFADELNSLIENKIERLDAELPGQLIDAPVKKFITVLFEDAVRINASDIHIEPAENVLRIRMRVDGILHERVLNEQNIAPAITQYMKLMGDLNIAEKRLPQDGRFTIKVQNVPLDVRLSTMPIAHGESVVARLLNQSGNRIKLDHIGMQPETLKEFRRFIHTTHGIILVTGPTGSGKTTTLYSALSELNTADKKIITIEDPVEYALERICQVQVRSKIGLNFSKILRSILRQDPDIIFVGEMRDNETATIAMRAALTGHLVLSTIHTNDAASTATRLLNMGLPGYLVAATVECAIAQRLIRKICTRCKTEYQPTPIEMDWLSKFSDPTVKDRQFYFGTGCAFCNELGYLGRTGIFEFLPFSEQMLTALVNQDEEAFKNLAKKALENKTLLDQAVNVALSGETTLADVIRISGEVI